MEWGKGVAGVAGKEAVGWRGETTGVCCGVPRQTGGDEAAAIGFGACVRVFCIRGVSLV